LARPPTRIAAIRQERVRIQQAPPHKADIKLKAREYVEAMIAKGRPRIIATHEAPFFGVNFDAMVAGAWTTQQDVAAAMCWLDPAAFAKRLNAEIDAMPQNEFSISHRERNQRLRLADQDLFQLERCEELLIAQGEEDVGRGRRDGLPRERKLVLRRHQSKRSEMARLASTLIPKFPAG
jgi:hypothetical protein